MDNTKAQNQPVKKYSLRRSLRAFRKRRFSASFVLTLLLIFVIGVFGQLAAGFVFHTVSISTQEILEKNIQQEMQTVMESIQFFLLDRVVVLRSWAKLPDIRQAVVFPDKNPDKTADFLRNLSLSRAGPTEFVLVDTKKRRKASIRTDNQKKTQDASWMDDILTGKKEYHLGIRQDHKDFTWCIAVPVYDAGMVQGALVAQIPLDEIRSRLIKPLTTNRMELIWHNASIASFGSDIHASWRDFYMKSLGLTLRFHLNPEPLENTRRVLRLEISMIIAVMSILMLPFAVVTANRLVAKPLYHLGHVADRIARGSSFARAKSDYVIREINQLGNDLNAMGKTITDRESALRHAQATLEQKVKDRTKALEESQKALLHTNENLESLVEERTHELKEMQLQMVIQEKMASLGQLAAGVAHEINNPLNFVNTNFAALKKYMKDFTDLLQDYRNLATMTDDLSDLPAELEAIKKKESAMHLDFIVDDMDVLFSESKDGFERISWIIDSMKNFSRSEKSHEKTLYDLNKGISNTLVIAKNEYKYHADMETSLKLTEKIPCVAQQINQVLLNLIVNAAHAIASADKKEKGKITIGTKREDQFAVIVVTDDGTGIPEEVKLHIFEPFFTTKEPGKGTGLGLSISYDIVVNKHGGTITCEDNIPAGTVFTIRLPIGAEDASSKQTTKPEAV